MSARCPEGHLSDSLDYCDVCGSPMGSAGGAGTAPSTDAGAPDLPDPESRTEAETQTCPHCGALNVEDALFCEACGYDFTTGTPPMGAEPAGDGGADEVEADEDAGSVPGPEADEQDVPAEPPEPQAEPAEQGAEPTPEPRTEPAVEPAVEPAATEAEPEPEPGEAAEAAEAAEVTARRKARHAPPSRALAEAWVVELWVDPDWYAVQQTEEACPSAGVPDIVLLTRSAALIGRPSGSLGVRPEVDAGADSAVSRRHAQLTSDGQRWWVEDLGSSNGTFVGTVGEPLPTAPIPPGQRVEIDRDDRLYVGAWTRIVLRQATASERQGTG